MVQEAAVGGGARDGDTEAQAVVQVPVQVAATAALDRSPLEAKVVVLTMPMEALAGQQRALRLQQGDELAGVEAAARSALHQPLLPLGLWWAEDLEDLGELEGLPAGYPSLTRHLPPPLPLLTAALLLAVSTNLWLPYLL